MPKPSTRLKTHTAPEARYVNYFEVGHNALEFIVDLGQYHPEQVAVQLQMRVVTAPVYAKLLCRMLMEAIERHEREHGVIQLEPSPTRSAATTTKMRSFEGAILE